MANEIASKAVERWADNEVEAFLSIYSEDCIQTGQRSNEVYQTISLRLAQMGIYHTPKQCREKIKKLKQDYKKTKDMIMQSGGANRRTSKWFHALDLILGRPPLAFVDGTQWAATTDNVSITMLNLDYGVSSAEDPEPPEQKPSVSGKSIDKWSHLEVQSLLKIYAESDIQRELGMWRRNEKVYQKISRRLAELGIHHSSKHCRDKIKKMKQDYRRLKEQESAAGERGSIRLSISRPLWFDAFDAILQGQKCEDAQHQGDTLFMEEDMSDDGHMSNNEQESSAEDDQSEALHQEEHGSADSPASSSRDPVSHPYILTSPRHISNHIKGSPSERVQLEEAGSMGSAVTSGSPPRPTTPSSHHISPSRPPEQTRGKRKREPELLEDVMRQMERREAAFLERMQEMEQAHLGIMRQELQQRERYFQMLLEHNQQEAKAREREFALRKEEVAEARRQQEAFQQGFLSTLSQLVQVLDKRRDSQPVAPPLD